MEMGLHASTMAAFKISTIAEYKEGQEDFESYLERLDMWMIASDVDNDKKVIVFLSVIGADVYRLLKNFRSPDKPSPKTYKELCDALREHHKPIVIVERFRFQRRNQQDGELVADYLVALRQLSTDCAHLNDALHHWFVSRLKSEDVQKKMDMLLNTGACATLLLEIIYRSFIKSHCLTYLLRDATRYCSLLRDREIPTLGELKVNAKYEQQTAQLSLVIVKGDGPALLGCDWLDNFRLDGGKRFSVRATGSASDADVEAVLQRHKAVFEEGPSTIQEFKASFRVKPKTQPIFKKIRQVPYALRESTKKRNWID